MSEIDLLFQRCRTEKRSAFIPFIMAGDPNLKRTPELMTALVDAGADLIELGVPFSDPIADGPTNQRAAMRSLASGTHLSGILRLVAQHRDRLGVPIVLFSYFNPIHHRGLTTFAEQASASGVDGVLCVDLPPEEAMKDYIPTMREHEVDTVFLVAPTSHRSRLKQVNEASTGFTYYVARTGVTGQRRELPKELLKTVKRTRRKIDLPLAVGFGISTPEQVAQVGAVSDAVVVGSALVKVIEEGGDGDHTALRLAERTSDLAEVLRS